MSKQADLQETAQALFCAMADYLGVAKVETIFDLKVNDTYTKFKEAWESKHPSLTVSTVLKTRVDAPGDSLKEIEALFHSDNDWYRSSVQIAKKVIEEVDAISTKFARIKSPNWSDLFYSRGDKEVMGNISALFSIANGTQKKLNALPNAVHKTIFTNLNKWCPADIYFASEKAKRDIKELLRVNQNKSMTFTVLNGLVSSLIDSGDLLPLSLKQQPGTVTIKKVNFDRKKELKDMEKFQFLSVEKWEPYVKNGKQARYLSIRYDPASPRSFIYIRHDPATPAFKAEVVHASGGATVSREGSAPPGVMEKSIALADGNTNYSRKFFKTFKDGEAEFAKEMKTKRMTEMKSKDRTKFDVERTWLSSSLITNAVFPELIKWLKRDKKNSTRFVQLVFAYTTSRSDESGKFVIAK